MLLLALLALLGACSSGTGPGGMLVVDELPPNVGLVNDGDDADIDEQTSRTSLSANWFGFTDSQSPIDYFEWAIVTADGGWVANWVRTESATRARNDDLALEPGQSYSVLVRAVDAAGNASAPGVSDGVLILDEPPPITSEHFGSVQRHDITWTFDGDYEIGQFANGDPWVVGPVNIVSITPRTMAVGTRTINGSMINPEPDGIQGYDSKLYSSAHAATRWDPQLNVALDISAGRPLRVPTGSSLISTISQIEPAPPSQSQLKTAAVLTILAQRPPTGAFRPPYSGSDKTIRFRESDLDYSAVANLPIPAGTTETDRIAQRFERVWLDHSPGWLSRFMHPVDNMPDYSRNFTAEIGTAALLVNLDFPMVEKRDLMVSLAQLGIDNWGNVLGGCKWPGTGGQCSGRKFPILFAGAVLHDQAMLDVGRTHPSQYLGPEHPDNQSWFGEDSQTFYVLETSAGVFNWGYGGYSPEYKGMPDWGYSHSHDPTRDAIEWNHDLYRRCCTANAWMGQCLAARIMNLREAWRHDAFFDYVDRYSVIEPSGWQRSWKPWHEVMWEIYRPQF